MLFPFALREIEAPDAAVAALFTRSFRMPPPAAPRHFVGALRADGTTAAYIHFTQAEPGVYLCGGLCVDARLYRMLTDAERAEVASHGSLSRWMLEHATRSLGSLRAVFAYTGNTHTRRDVLAIGYVPAAPLLWPFTRARKYLLVQWHSEPTANRGKLARLIAARGPF